MSKRMRARAFVIASAVAAAMVLGPLAAMAHPVSQYGEPNCFGMRISHGAASSHANGGHEMTPVERAAQLQQVIDEVRASGSPEEIALVDELFGQTVSVQEFIRFVKLNCSDDPLFLPFDEN